MNTKKRHISETKKPKSKPRTPMSLQHTYNAIKIQKNVTVYFQDAKTE